MNSMRVSLTVPRGSVDGAEYVFEEPGRCIIGRAEDCDIRVPLDYLHADVSRHHCLLEIDPPSIRVRDLGSRNGTFVNGEMIGRRPIQQAAEGADVNAAARELKDGDEILVGNTVFQVGVAPPSGIPDLVCFPVHFV